MDEQEQALSGEILSDARKRADRVLQRARREADKVLAGARKDAEAGREQVIAAAARQAEHESEISGGRVEHELGLLRLDVQHAMVERVRAEARRLLAELAAGPDARASLAALALGAVEAMSGDGFRLVLRPQDREQWGRELAAAVQAAAHERLGRDVRVSVSDEELDAPGGLIVLGDGEHEMADQTYGARLARLWDGMRADVASLLPQVAGPEAGEAAAEDGEDE